MLGLPLTVAIIGGEPHRFRPLVDLYREAGRRAGHAPEIARCRGSLDRLYRRNRSAGGQRALARLLAYLQPYRKERGWGPLTRAAFDAQRDPTGAFVVGSPETAAKKMQHISDSLGGVSQVSLMMSGGPLAHDKMVRAIELLGTEVKPRLQSAEVAA